MSGMVGGVDDAMCAVGGCVGVDVGCGCSMALDLIWEWWFDRLRYFVFKMCCWRAYL